MSSFGVKRSNSISSMMSILSISIFDKTSFLLTISESKFSSLLINGELLDSIFRKEFLS